MKALETPETQQSLIAGLFYLVRVSEVDDVEIFRICLEAWHMLAHDLYQTESEFRRPGVGGVSSSLNLGGGTNGSSSVSRKYLYGPVLTGVRQVMIAKMAKPEEVLIVEDENGDIVRETTKDTDVIAQYKTMRETRKSFSSPASFVFVQNIGLRRSRGGCDAGQMTRTQCFELRSCGTWRAQRGGVVRAET